MKKISPLLDGFISLLNPNITKETCKLYDPYYCNGRTKVLLQQLGYTSHNIIHEKRDFYKDMHDRTIPKHDILITNPPYSNEHKIQCLQFCRDNLSRHKVPFFILMPNYIACKQYYKNIITRTKTTTTTTTTKEDDKEERENEESDILYVIPSTPYEYEHPDGTGKDIPPFHSLWYCGVGKENISKLKIYWDKHYHDQQHQRQQSSSSRCSSNSGSRRPRLVTSFKELSQLGVIPTENRKNPRQRKKFQLRQQQQQKLQSSNETNTAMTAVTSTNNNEVLIDECAGTGQSQSSKFQNYNHNMKKDNNDTTNKNKNNSTITTITTTTTKTTTAAATAAATSSSSTTKKKRKKNSRYRDREGKRTKARF